MKRRILLALLALCHSPVYANSINSTASPSATSSGSVTNLGVMNMPTRQFQNQVGPQAVTCQGDTLVIQPFLASNLSFAEPNIEFYDVPVYSTRDLEGAFDDEGNPIGDGDPDDPSLVIGTHRKQRFEKSQYSISPGISVSFNISLDRRAQRTCLEAMEKQRDLLAAAYEDKRLSYELGRMKICAEQLKLGVTWKKTSKYYRLCEDIALVNPPGVLPDHKHTISYPGNATSSQ